MTFYDGSVKLGDATTAYTVEPFEGISRTGYTPVWKDKPENGTVFDFSRPITEDTSLYLDWVKQTCTLTFDSTGGSSVAAITAEYGDAITEPEAPERAGYTFGGWYTDEACTQPYEFSTMGESRTVYAKWTRKTQTAADPEAGGCGRNGTGTALVGVIAALACVGIGRKGF